MFPEDFGIRIFSHWGVRFDDSISGYSYDMECKENVWGTDWKFAHAGTHYGARILNCLTPELAITAAVKEIKNHYKTAKIKLEKHND
jgi:hypothetical protein